MRATEIDLVEIDREQDLSGGVRELHPPAGPCISCPVVILQKLLQSLHHLSSSTGVVDLRKKDASLISKDARAIGEAQEVPHERDSESKGHEPQPERMF